MAGLSAAATLRFEPAARVRRLARAEEGDNAIAIGYPRLPDVLRMGLTIHPTVFPVTITGEAMGRSRTTGQPIPFAQITGFMKQLGSDFETAWAAGENLDDNSADGKAYNTALDELSNKCS